MKTVGASLATHFSSECTTVARLFKITRGDGQVFGFTDHDQDIAYGGVVYSAATAIDPSTVAGGSDLAVDNLEAAGAFDSAAITEQDLEAGRWDNAAVWVADINWADTTQGVMILRVGRIGRVRRSGKGFSAELLGLAQNLQTNIGRTALPTCDAVLGDARCGVTLTTFTHTGTVTSVTSRSVFTDSALAQAAGYFRYGKVTFTSGLNNGVAIDIAEHTTGGVLRTVIDLPFAVAVGDTFTAIAGCNKIARTADGGDCEATFDNLVNFRGFPDVPGNEALIGALE